MINVVVVLLFPLLFVPWLTQQQLAYTLHRVHNGVRKKCLICATSSMAKWADDVDKSKTYIAPVLSYCALMQYKFIASVVACIVDRGVSKVTRRESKGEAIHTSIVSKHKGTMPHPYLRFKKLQSCPHLHLSSNAARTWTGSATQRGGTWLGLGGVRMTFNTALALQCSSEDGKDLNLRCMEFQGLLLVHPAIC